MEAVELVVPPLLHAASGKTANNKQVSSDKNDRLEKYISLSFFPKKFIIARYVIYPSVDML
jgi:hypothetical protein